MSDYSHSRLDSTKIGNKKSKVYHSPQCYCVAIMREDNKVHLDHGFNDKKGKHYRPCSKCKPDINTNNTTLPVFDKGVVSDA